MRLTFNAVRDGLEAVNTASEQYAKAQWQVSSGRRLHAPSDDPASAQRAVTDQGQVTTLDAYTQSAASANSRLTVLDTALGDIVNQITLALTAVQSARGSDVSQATRDAAAATLQSARDAIAADVNTTFQGDYLFAGSKFNTAPYSNATSAWVYQGDSTATAVNIDERRTVNISVDGKAVLQGSDPTDLLTLLDNLTASVKAGDANAMNAGMDDLNRAFNRATLAQTNVGTDENRVSDAQTRLTNLTTAAKSQLSTEQDADLAAALASMARAQTAYQAALGAVGTAQKTSLMDYLK